MDWNRTPIEPVAPHELIPTAQQKKRPAEKRPWEQQPENAVRRYRLPENLYGKVCRITTQNELSSISQVAIQLMDYSLYQRSQGVPIFQIYARPNPLGRKFRIVWQAAQVGWNGQSNLTPDFGRGKQKAEEKVLPGEYGGRLKEVGLRLGAMRQRIKGVAEELHLPISEVAAFLLAQAVMAYEAGKFQLVLEHIATQTASGWQSSEPAPKSDSGFLGNGWSISG
jgi:hypothetical protein